jgi:hypothetical protein
MKLYLFAGILLMTACSSSENRARETLAQARALLEEARQFYPKELDACIAKGNEAKGKIDEIYSKYASTPVANELGTQLLKSEINMRVRECVDVKRIPERTPGSGN